MKSGLAFHCHHHILAEYVHNYEERVKYIKENKPAEEQELRLRLFKLIPENRIPGRDSPELTAYSKATTTLNKTEEACKKAGVACGKTWETYVLAWEAYLKARGEYDIKYGREFDRVHDELCPDCPWDGETIFTK